MISQLDFNGHSLKGVWPQEVVGGIFASPPPQGSKSLGFTKFQIIMHRQYRFLRGSKWRNEGSSPTIFSRHPCLQKDVASKLFTLKRVDRNVPKEPSESLKKRRCKKRCVGHLFGADALTNSWPAFCLQILMLSRPHGTRPFTAKLLRLNHDLRLLLIVCHRCLKYSSNSVAYLLPILKKITQKGPWYSPAYMT